MKQCCLLYVSAFLYLKKNVLEIYSETHRSSYFVQDLGHVNYIFEVSQAQTSRAIALNGVLIKFNKADQAGLGLYRN